MDGHLDYFQFRVITKNIVAAILAHVFGAHMCAFLLGTDLKVEFLDNMVNLYAFYILENALRISVLEILGIEVADDIKKYNMDDHLDWIKLRKHLEEDCVLPMNVFCQMIERLQKS